MYKGCFVETMKHMAKIRFFFGVESGMVFAQELVASGIRTMHRGGCGISNIFIHTDHANVHMGVGHLGVLDVFVGITYCYHHMSNMSHHITGIVQDLTQCGGDAIEQQGL